MKRLNERLDRAIAAILEDPETELPAEAINALHGATSTHPWGQGRPIHERALSAYYAIAGRRVSAALARDLRRVALGLPGRITNVAGTTYRVGDRVRAIGDGWTGTVTAIDAFGRVAMLIVEPDDLASLPDRLRRGSAVVIRPGRSCAVAAIPSVPQTLGLSMGNFEKIAAAQ